MGAIGGGYLKFHRKFFENPMFTSDVENRRVCRSMAWLYLISIAEYSGTERYVRTQYRTEKKYVKPGMIPFSKREIARQLGWHNTRLSRFVEHLTEEGMIEVQEGKIFILNYDRYQTGNGKPEPKKKAVQEAAQEEVVPGGVKEVLEAMNDSIMKIAKTHSYSYRPRNLTGRFRDIAKTRIATHGLDRVLLAMKNLPRSDYHCGTGKYKGNGARLSIDNVMGETSKISQVDVLANLTPSDQNEFGLPTVKKSKISPMKDGALPPNMGGELQKAYRWSRYLQTFKTVEEWVSEETLREQAGPPAWEGDE